MARNVLWEYLNYFSITNTLPWVVIGDFNELVSSSDKKGGSLTGNFGGLRDWVQNCAMVGVIVELISHGQIKEFKKGWIEASAMVSGEWCSLMLTSNT